jgi:cystathionine beta-lyase/cystathionine gamma-synthase
VHAGEIRPRVCGAVTLPVFQSATFEYAGGDDEILRYARLNNTPNHDALHAKIAALEEAEAAWVAGSGMAAISAALLSVLRGGDHLLHQETLYGGTHTLVHTDLAALGIGHAAVDSTRPETWAAALTPATRAFYVETIGNPLMTVPDLAAVVAFCREHGLVSIVDNTFASPVFFRPVPFGFDLVVHSCTKYMNGHSDVVAGCVAGSVARIESVASKLERLGSTLDPHACFLLHRGLKTLPLRMRRHADNALAVAGWLERHPRVSRVFHPGLPSSPEHERARRFLDGAGGMLSFEIEGDAAAADRFLRRLTVPVVASSLGGVESLISRPAVSSHAGLSAAERAQRGITDGLIRLSVGIEDAEDLIEDMACALDGTPGNGSTGGGGRWT